MSVWRIHVNNPMPRQREAAAEVRIRAISLAAPLSSFEGSIEHAQPQSRPASLNMRSPRDKLYVHDGAKHHQCGKPSLTQLQQVGILKLGKALRRASLHGLQLSLLRETHACFNNDSGRVAAQR